MHRFTGEQLRERVRVGFAAAAARADALKADAPTAAAARHDDVTTSAAAVAPPLKTPQPDAAPPSPHRAAPARDARWRAAVDNAVAITTLCLVFGLGYYVLPLLPIPLLYLTLQGSRWAGALLTVLLVDALLPPVETENLRAIAPLRWCLWRSWRRYFRYEIISEVPLDAKATYVFASHPHGVFPMGQWLSVPASCDAVEDATDAAVLAALPTRMRGAVATCLLHLPVLRHLMAWAGMVPAHGPVLRRLLARGTSVVLIPGGIAEIFVSRPEEEVLVLSERKGFVRAALEANVPIVPIFCFGNTSCFRVRPPPRDLVALSRRARVGLLLFWGRAGLPVPFRTKLLVAVGPPVVPRPGEGVDQLHARYCEALNGLFERHKAKLGPEWERKTLQIT